MDLKHKRRFIAGAICPACRAMDRIVVSVVQNETICECVACGFKDKQITPEDDKPDGLTMAADEKNQSSERDKSAQVIRILPLDN